jgi:hypothetical protein
MPGAASDLTARLRRLFDAAERGGEPGVWLDETAELLAEELRALAGFRLGAQDPRRRQTLEDAEKLRDLLADWKRAGYSVEESHERARERFGRDRFYRLLRWSELHDFVQLEVDTLRTPREKA